MAPPRYVLIANAGTVRCETYRRELAAYWAAHGTAVDVAVVPWAAVAARDGNLNDLPAFDRPAVVRLESPGKCEAALRALLAAGARDGTELASDWSTAPIRPGELVRPGLWYRGFARVLRGLRAAFDARPHLAPTACPLAVAAMFDKTATAARLAAAGVPVPEWVPPVRLPNDPADLAGFVSALGWPTTFVKLNTGSAATGIVAVSAGRGVTTLARLGDGWFSTRAVQRVQGADLAAACAFLRREGVLVQRGVPLAQIDGANFDVRVVCVSGVPAGSVFRLSPHPMTNLHLGGRRGDHARCRAAIPARAWLDALDHATTAAGAFRSAVAGVDVAFERGSFRPFVLEVNAFGDFFPGWTDPAGRSFHAREIAATADRAFA